MKIVVTEFQSDVEQSSTTITVSQGLQGARGPAGEGGGQASVYWLEWDGTAYQPEEWLNLTDKPKVFAGGPDDPDSTATVTDRDEWHRLIPAVDPDPAAAAIFIRSAGAWVATGITAGDVAGGFTYLQNQLDTEVDARAAADDDLQSQITALPTMDQLSATVEQARVALQAAIDSEAEVRGIIDTDILAEVDTTTNGLSAEVGARADADTAEAIARAAADTTNADAIATETAARIAADANKADLVSGVLPTSQIPTIAITDVFPVADQAAMLALTAQRGDLAVRADTGHRFILRSDSPSTLADWIDLGKSTSDVTSVNGQVGIIVLGYADVGADASGAAVAAQAAAIAAASSDATTKANGAQAFAIQRGNHTGSQTLSTISDAGSAASHPASDFQPSDATLTALAALATGANKLAYSTGSDTFAQTDLTALARTILGRSATSDIRIDIGLGNSATRNVGTATGTVAVGDDVRFKVLPQSAFTNTATVALNQIITPGTDVPAFGYNIVQTNASVGGERLVIDLSASSTGLQLLDDTVDNNVLANCPAKTITYFCCPGGNTLRILAQTPSDYNVSTFMKTVLDDADAATARATLGINGSGDASSAAEMIGVKIVAIDPHVAYNFATLSSGTLIFMRVRSRYAQTITKLGCCIRTPGVTSSGVNAMAIFSSSGTLLQQTGDMTSAFQTANTYVEGTLGSSVALTANTDYDIAILAHFSGTSPTVNAVVPTAGVPIPAINGTYISTSKSAQTTMPSTSTPSSRDLNNASYLFTAT